MKISMGSHLTNAAKLSSDRGPALPKAISPAETNKWPVTAQDRPVAGEPPAKLVLDRLGQKKQVFGDAGFRYVAQRLDAGPERDIGNGLVSRVESERMGVRVFSAEIFD